MNFYRVSTFIFLCSLNWANATTTTNDLKRKHIKIVDAYADDRGVILLKVKYQDPSGPTPNPSFIVANTFMCFQSNCHQLEANGSLQLNNEGKFFNMKSRIVLDDTNKKGLWTVDLENGSESTLECPKFTKKLRNVSMNEIEKLTKEIHSGDTVLISLPEEVSLPKFYYEDADKNVIFIDETKFKIPTSYHYYEGKAGDLKEVKVKDVFVSIPGNPVLTLEDGRKIHVGSHTKEIKRDKQFYKAKDISSIDIDALKIPRANLYKFTLNTPCLETFSLQSNCVSDHECPEALLINDSRKSHLKPLFEEKVRAPAKNEGGVIPR